MEENLYEKICSFNNLAIAYKNARKGKTKRYYVKEFERDLRANLFNLREELLNGTYKPEPLKTFILCDPKTRRISKSTFRDRIIHHALIQIIEPIFERIFIYDSCANRKGRGTLFALKRFDEFKMKVTDNLSKEAFCLKADIKHYFQEVDRKVLFDILQRRLSDKKAIQLIKLILSSFDNDKGMPLGNLTSQFFANVYLNELDYFIKNKLRAKFYIRYVDDFVIFHKSKMQLNNWKVYIENFLKDRLRLELHKEKSRIVSLSKGIDFVGFRNFYYFKILRKRNILKMKQKITQFNKGTLTKEKFKESLNGWLAYSKWANNHHLQKRLFVNIKEVAITQTFPALPLPKNVILK